MGHLSRGYVTGTLLSSVCVRACTCILEAILKVCGEGAAAVCVHVCVRACVRAVVTCLRLGHD